MLFKAKRAQGGSGTASLIRFHLWLKKKQNLRLPEGLGSSRDTQAIVFGCAMGVTQ